MTLFLLMNFIVILSAYIITYKLFKVQDFSDALVSWFIFYFAQIILTELILGILGSLYLKNVILLNLAILSAVWLMTRNTASSFRINRVKDAFMELLSNKIIFLATAAILGFGLIKITVNLVNAPFGWDSLNYHFSFPVEWLKHGNLDMPITIADDPSPSYYPINGSLFFLWLILPFRSVFMADLGQLPFFILAFISVYSLGIKLNLGRDSSFLSACLFSLIPNYFKQLQVAYVDIMAAALFLAALNALFILKESFTIKNSLIYGIALGLLLGTKTTALPYTALLFLPLVYLVFKNIKKSPGVIIVSLLAIIIFGSFTYIRNFIDTGNPLYPLDFKLAGKVIFRGVMDTATYGAHFHRQDYLLTKLLFHEGLGAQTILFILPFIFLVLPIAFIKKRKILDFHLIYFLALPLMIYLAYRYMIPLPNVRYIYNLFGVGILVAFWGITVLNFPKALVKIAVLICVLASMAELAKKQELIAAFILTIFFMFLLTVFIKKPRIIIAFLILVFCSLIFLGKYYSKNEYTSYVKMVKYSGFWPDACRAWAWLDQHTDGNNIAYTGRPVPFPLYGENFKNNVYYVSVNKTDPEKLHYFRQSYYRWDDDFLNLYKNLEAKGNYRADADYSAWVANLIKRHTEYLFVYSFNQIKTTEFPLEDKWAIANPARFTPVFTNATIRIYKIVDSRQ